MMHNLMETPKVAIVGFLIDQLIVFTIGPGREPAKVWVHGLYRGFNRSNHMFNK